jgi:hypothetical protein
MRVLKTTLIAACATPLMWALTAGPSATQQAQTPPAPPPPPAAAATQGAAPSQSAPATASQTAPAQRLDLCARPTPSGLGQNVSGEIVITDPATRAGNPHHSYSMQLTKDQVILATMTPQAERLEAFLAVGRCGTDNAFNSRTTASGGGSLRPAVLRFTVPETGEYVFRAVGLNKTVGRYTMAFAERVSPPAPPPTPIAVGQTVTGEISETSPLLLDDGDRAYTRYVMTLTAPTRLRLTFNSEDFSTKLRFGRRSASGAMEVITSSTNGTSDRSVKEELFYLVTAPGEYLIDVAGETPTSMGEYQLGVLSLPGVEAAGKPAKLERDAPITARLAWTDQTVPTTSTTQPDTFRPYDLYELEGRRGDVMLVTVESQDFDTAIEVGAQTPVGFATAIRNTYHPDYSVHQFTSQSKVVFDRNGSATIRVAADRRGAIGAYTIKAERAPAPGAGTPPATPSGTR